MAPFRRPRPAGATKPAPDGAASTLLSTWQQQKHLPPIDPKLSGEQVRRGMNLGRFELTRKLGTFTSLELSHPYNTQARASSRRCSSA